MKAKTILQFAIGPIGAAVLSLITLPFVAWFFSVEDVGRLTMLQVVLGLSASLFSLAMHQAYVREYHEVEDKKSLFKLSVIPGLLLLILLFLITLILPFSISDVLFGIDSGLLTFLLLVAVFSSFFINFLAHVIRMEERGLAFSATQIAPKAFLLIFISLIMLFNLVAEFKTLILMNTLSIICSLFIFSWLTRDTWIPAIRIQINVILLKKMLKFSLPLVAGGIAYWGLTTMDRFFLRNLSGFDELGVYALAAALAGSVSVITSIFSSLWHPTLYKWVKKGIDPNKIQFVIENMLFVVVLIWTLVGILSFLVPLFLPKEYLSIEYLIVACVAMPLFYLLSETTGVGIGITRHSSYSMIASIVAFMVNGILNYLLIPEYGASGAALATLIAFFVFFTIKTEASVWLWRPFPRLKIYLILLGYIVTTCLFVITKAKIPYFYCIWIILLVLTCCSYASRLANTTTFLMKYINKKV